MNKNIWEEFANLNGMSPDDFLNEITLVAMSLLSLKLDETGENAIKINHGQYTLLLIDNEKDEDK